MNVPLDVIALLFKTHPHVYVCPSTRVVCATHINVYVCIHAKAFLAFLLLRKIICRFFTLCELVFFFRYTIFLHRKRFVLCRFYV